MERQVEDSNDDQDPPLQQTPEPFKIIPACRPAPNPPPAPTTWETIKFQIGNHTRQVLKHKLQTKADIIADQMQNDIAKQNMIFTVRFKHEQRSELKQFIDILQRKVKDLVDRGVLKDYRVRRISEVQTTKILAQMYIYNQRNEDKNIFLVDGISEFGERDVKRFIKCFKTIHIVIPTYNDLSMSPISIYKILLVMQIYDSKAMFCRLFLSVLQDQFLCPYLPKQSLRLITDYDYYPLSYSEGSRRLTYLINVLYNKGINYDAVNLKQLAGVLIPLLTINQSYSQEFRIEEKFVMTVLDENYKFRIPSGLLNTPYYSMKDSLATLAEDIQKAFAGSPGLQVYAGKVGNLCRNIIENKSFNKRDRLAKLGIPKSAQDQGDMLNQQLSSIIKHATVNIRKQALTVPWEQFEFNERIRPQLDHDIVQDVGMSKLAGLLSVTTKFIKTSHKTALFLSGLTPEEYDYQMCVLEFLGLIDFTRKQIDPAFRNQLFKKTDFRGV